MAILAIEDGRDGGARRRGLVVGRFGSGGRSSGATLVFGPRSLAAGVAPGLGWLAAALAIWAAANGVIDVAMNSQGGELERSADRPLLSGMHAAHSFGLLAGGLDGRGRRCAPASRSLSHAIVVVAVAVTLA